MLHSSLWQRAGATLIFVMLLTLLLPIAVFARTTITLNPTSSADGHFTASNVQYNPTTSEVTFDGSGFNPASTWYDSAGISICNDSSICALDKGEYWGPSTYFSNYQQFPLIDPQHFDITFTFNSYRPTAGTVFLWVKTDGAERTYSQALDYNTITAGFPQPTSAYGHFTASNVQYNPTTSEVTFDGSGFNPFATWYDSVGISSCNDANICALDSGEYWGPSTYFSNYQQFPLIDPQHFDITFTFNSYRPSGVVFLWVKTDADVRTYSQALYYNSLVTNTPPQINLISSATINEGATYTANGSFTDSDSTSWTATVDYGGSSGTQPLTLSGMNFSLSYQYTDEGTYTVTVKITDNQGATGTGTATITVNNTTPSVGAITVSNPVIQVNSSSTASASFTDAAVKDTHTATWDWGDTINGNPDITTGTVTESNGSGSISDSHTYTTAGVYTITLTVTDDDGTQPRTQTYQYVSVYNPTAQGLFTAGQKYTSPAGAYSQNPSLTGTVLFGLSYKYQGTVPRSDRQFTMKFNAANFTFNATTVSSLVISNGIGTLTGTGTVSGLSGTYHFLVTGSESTNTIRIQITDSNGNVVYDTQPGATTIAAPTTSVTGQVLAH